jgi:hypothetical protein
LFGNGKREEIRITLKGGFGSVEVGNLEGNEITYVNGNEKAH